MVEYAGGLGEGTGSMHARHCALLHCACTRWQTTPNFAGTGRVRGRAPRAKFCNFTVNKRDFYRSMTCMSMSIHARETPQSTETRSAMMPSILSEYVYSFDGHGDSLGFAHSALIHVGRDASSHGYVLPPSLRERAWLVCVRLFVHATDRVSLV